MVEESRVSILIGVDRLSEIQLAPPKLTVLVSTLRAPGRVCRYRRSKCSGEWVADRVAVGDVAARCLSRGNHSCGGYIGTGRIKLTYSYAWRTEMLEKRRKWVR